MKTMLIYILNVILHAFNSICYLIIFIFESGWKHRVQYTIFEAATLNMADTSAKRLLDSDKTGEPAPDVKRGKTDNENGREDGNESVQENVLSGFKTSSVLSDSAREKNIFVHGKVALLQS